MNILFFIGSYCDYGGAQKVVTILSDEFVRRGWNVVLATLNGRNEPKKLGLNPDIKTYELRPCPVIRLRRILKENKIDVIFNHWALPFYVGWLMNVAKIGLRCKLVSVLHGMPDRCKLTIVAGDDLKKASSLMRPYAMLRLWLLHRIVRWSLRYMYESSDEYVLLSESFFASFKRYSGISDDGHLHAIGNPITISTEFGNQPRRWGNKQILYVGRMDKENKRVNRIIEVWEEIANYYPGWNLMLVGGGPHLKELQTYVQDKDIPRVRFAGFVKDDPVDYYRNSSVFMLTSDLEGFGLVILEAMSFGVVPIVYGSYSAVHDIIDNQVNGIITPFPYSKEHTIRELKNLLDDEEMRRKMSDAAVDKARKFSVVEVCNQWEDLMR